MYLETLCYVMLYLPWTINFIVSSSPHDLFSSHLILLQQWSSPIHPQTQTWRIRRRRRSLFKSLSNLEAEARELFPIFYLPIRIFPSISLSLSFHPHPRHITIFDFPTHFHLRNSYTGRRRRRRALSLSCIHISRIIEMPRAKMSFISFHHSSQYT